jgi:hypothetical protein
MIVFSTVSGSTAVAPPSSSERFFIPEGFDVAAMLR